MKKITGDLIKYAEAGHVDVIVHGCNCFHTMGSGIAKQIRERWPGAYVADQATEKGDHVKLGSYTTYTEGGLTIVNAYTQFAFGNDQRHCSYDAIDRAFRAIANEFSGLRIGYPQIGAGLAGGDWDVISIIITKALEGCDHTLVLYDGS